MHRGALIHCDDVEITSIYNAEFRGFANYYAMAYAAKQDLAKLQLIWQTSLYLTLAAKHRSTVNTMVRRYKIRPGQHVVWQVEKGERVQVKVWDLKDLIRRPVLLGLWIFDPRRSECRTLERVTLIACWRVPVQLVGVARGHSKSTM